MFHSNYKLFLEALKSNESKVASRKTLIINAVVDAVNNKKVERDKYKIEEYLVGYGVFSDKELFNVVEKVMKRTGSIKEELDQEEYVYPGLEEDNELSEEDLRGNDDIINAAWDIANSEE